MHPPSPTGTRCASLTPTTRASASTSSIHTPGSRKHHGIGAIAPPILAELPASASKKKPSPPVPDICNRSERTMKPNCSAAAKSSIATGAFHTWDHSPDCTSARYRLPARSAKYSVNITKAANTTHLNHAQLIVGNDPSHAPVNRSCNSPFAGWLPSPTSD